MRIAFRVDASRDIGTGHVMRCLSLANVLKSDPNNEIVFICRAHEGHLADVVRAKGYTVFVLPAHSQSNPAQWANKTQHASWLGVSQQEDAEQTLVLLNEHKISLDWLVVDHYALDAHWQTPLRKAARKILVIDDLADRVHDCDVLMDQNLHSNLETRYDAFVPRGCKTLLGPTYALLRPEFAQLRSTLKPHTGIIKRALLFFGGSDATNTTAKALRGLQGATGADFGLDVVCGPSNPHRKEIESLCAGMANVTFHFNISNMAELMAQSDLVLGAGGVTTWERCCLGRPSIVVSVADNQKTIAEMCAARGLIVYLGFDTSVTPDDFAKAVAELRANPEKVKHLSLASMAIVDGQGTGRVAEAMGLAKT